MVGFPTIGFPTKNQRLGCECFGGTTILSEHPYRHNGINVEFFRSIGKPSNMWISWAFTGGVFRNLAEVAGRELEGGEVASECRRKSYISIVYLVVRIT